MPRTTLNVEAQTAMAGTASGLMHRRSGVLLATGSKFVGRQSTIMGGKSSTGVLCAPSYSGVRFLNDGSSSVESIPGPAALFDGPGVVRPGESLAFNFQAGPGSWAYLLVSESTADLPLGDAGILHLLSPQILDLGPVGANGKLTWPTTLGLPPAPVTLLGLQAVAADPSIGAVIGQVRSLAWLAQ